MKAMEEIKVNVHRNMWINSDRKRPKCSSHWSFRCMFHLTKSSSTTSVCTHTNTCMFSTFQTAFNTILLILPSKIVYQRTNQFSSENKFFCQTFSCRIGETNSCFDWFHLIFKWYLWWPSNIISVNIRYSRTKQK